MPTVPLITTFVPLITISLVIGVVSIVTFTKVHEDQITESVNNAIDGSVRYVERNTAGPFFEVNGNAVIMKKNAQSQGMLVHRGAATPIYPSGSAVPTAGQLAAFRGLHLLFQSSILSVPPGLYVNVYQLYRIGLRSGATAGSLNPYDYEWGASGVFEVEARHNFNSTHHVAFSRGQQWPNFTSTDGVVRAGGPGATQVDFTRTLTAANASWPPALAPSWYEVRNDLSGSETLYSMVTLVHPISYDAAGFAESAIAFDVNAVSFLNGVGELGTIPIEATAFTMLNPHTADVVGTSFPTMNNPNYIRTVAGDPTTYRLFNSFSCPEPRLREAMKVIAAELGPLPNLPYRTQVLHPEGSDDIIGVRPMRQINLDFVLVSISDREHFFGKGEAVNRNAIIMCSVLLVVAFIVAVITAVMLSRPLSDLGDRMALTASLQEDDEKMSFSFATEIHVMQSAYVDMKAELERMKAYLPQSLLAANVDDDEESADDDDRSVDNQSDARGHTKDANASDSPARKLGARSSDRSSRSAAVAAKLLNMDRAVVLKRVVVGVFNLCGFNAMATSQDRQAIKVQREYLSIILDVSQRQKGVVDSFQGDHVIVTWNAVNITTMAAKRGAAAAWEICQSVNSLTPLSVTAGLSQGVALVGNAGTERMQRFNVIGAVFTQALAVERMAAKSVLAAASGPKAPLAAATRIFLSHTMISDIETGFLFRHRCFAQLGSNRALSPQCESLTLVSSLEGPRGNGGSGEWMYELQKNSEDDPYCVINAAYLALANGEIGAAFENDVAELPEAEQAELRAAQTELAAFRSLGLIDLP